MNSDYEKLSKSVSKYSRNKDIIEQYVISNKEKELLETEQQMEFAQADINTKEKKQIALEEDIEELRIQLGESETRQKLLRDNITLLDSMAYESELDEKMSHFKEELEAIAGFDTSQTRYNEAKTNIKENEIQKG